MANKDVANKGRQYLLLANEDLMSLTGHGRRGIRGALRAYEAWLLRDGVPEPAACFEPHNGTAAMSIEGSVKGADAVAVTVEPSGGSSTPTSEPLLIAALKPWHPRRLWSRCEG